MFSSLLWIYLKKYDLFFENFKFNHVKKISFLKKFIKIDTQKRRKYIWLKMIKILSDHYF